MAGSVLAGSWQGPALYPAMYPTVPGHVHPGLHPSPPVQPPGRTRTARDSTGTLATLNGSTLRTRLSGSLTYGYLPGPEYDLLGPEYDLPGP